jgi:hypothetical protein
MVRSGARALGAVFFDLVSAEEEGVPVVIDPKNAKLLSETLRNISHARRMDIETVARARAEERKAIIAEKKKQLDELAANASPGALDLKTLEEARHAMGFG